MKTPRDLQEQFDRLRTTNATMMGTSTVAAQAEATHQRAHYEATLKSAERVAAEAVERPTSLALKLKGLQQGATAAELAHDAEWMNLAANGELIPGSEDKKRLDRLDTRMGQARRRLHEEIRLGNIQATKMIERALALGVTLGPKIRWCRLVEQGATEDAATKMIELEAEMERQAAMQPTTPPEPREEVLFVPKELP